MEFNHCDCGRVKLELDPACDICLEELSGGKPTPPRPARIAAYTFRNFYIPVRMMPGLKRYTEKGILPGDFLTAVLRNDLRHAVERADDENMRNIPAYVGWLYNHAPAGCWGSPERVEQWVARKAEERKLEGEKPTDD